MEAGESKPKPVPSGAFRFKSRSEEDAHRTKRRKHYHRHHSHRSHRSSHRPHSERLSASPSSATHAQPSTPPLSPDTAFRESLFDALADDEGAAYWESVYGQPLHTYSRYKEASRQTKSTATGSEDIVYEDDETRGAWSEKDGDGGPTEPKLETMTDEEYVSYVRQKMWEKSHSHILEERERIKKDRERTRQEEREGQRQRSEWQERFDETIAGRGRRGRTGDTGVNSGREREKWKRAWQKYIQRWEELLHDDRGHGKAGLGVRLDPDGNEVNVKSRSKQEVKIPFPVRSLKAQDISKAAISDFFSNAPSAASVTNNTDRTPTMTEAALSAILKIERVRWHPDKVQQRVRRLMTSVDNDIPKDKEQLKQKKIVHDDHRNGAKESQGLDEPTMKAVTAVFQIIDGLWNEARGSGSLK